LHNAFKKDLFLICPISCAYAQSFSKKHHSSFSFGYPPPVCRLVCAPGSRGMLPSPSPLRTTHETFTSRGSSPRKGFPGWDSRGFTSTSRYKPAVRNSQRHTGRTSLKGRHLLSPLPSDSSGVHVIGHRAERLPPYGAGNVSPGIRTITARHSLFSASYSGPPTACLAVSLPPEGATGPGFHVPHS